jgi:hypothetical protein
MAEEILYSGRLTDEDFLKLIATCYELKMFADALALVELFPVQVIKPRARQDLLLFEQFSSGIHFAKFTSGRIFTEQLELRWERRGQKMHVVYLGKSEYASVLKDYRLEDSAKVKVIPDDLKRRSNKFYYLFGERLSPEDRERIGWAKPGDFAEVRIPRLLRYPPANWREPGREPIPEKEQKKPYMQLQVCEYLDKAGNVMLFRFRSLKATGELKA